jgi:cargo-transport protein YPP1
MAALQGRCLQYLLTILHLQQRRDPEKARHYINALDVARCQNNWGEIPELVRKVGKHAPQRKCMYNFKPVVNRVLTESLWTGLTLAGSSEWKVATTAVRPSTASSAPNPLSELITPLRSILEGEIPFYQDGLQAKICLGWIYWSLSQHDMTLAILPKDFGVILQELARNAKEPYGWTEVCVVKGAFIKASAQEQVLGTAAALGTFRSVMSWILERASKPPTSPQQLFWEQQFLARAATLASRELSSSRENISFTLTAFRLWAKLGASRHEFTPIGTDTPVGGSLSSPPQIWKAYYDFVSKVLQQELPYPPSASLVAQIQKGETKTRLPIRAQQVAELRRCESVYEATFLKSVRFPRASGSNEDVEEWVEQVIRNYEILCGPDWHDDELGEGGQNAVGRNVLDVLYRAASKTFHSTLILRRLFQVHASLTDFDLAFKALGSYIEIMQRGRARTEASDETKSELDDVETFLNTICDGISILCQFGAMKEAEQAQEYSDMLEKELKKYREPPHEAMTNGDVSEDDVTELPRSDTLSKQCFATVYRGIGIGLANWARWTPINESRSEIQAKAIGYLKRSVALRDSNSTDQETSFALGLLLAETRDINGAIEVVKGCLASNTPASPPSKHLSTTRRSYERERHLIPLWHLLSLLLSGRQDFDTAVRSCEAAIEQFPSPSVLFGDKSTAGQSVDGETEKSSIPPFHLRPENVRGVIDDMESVERERVLEIRMTELALTEVLEGPDIAVNSSNELLSLFLRLFGDLGIDMEDPTPKKELPPVPPKSSAGTLKSFKGSLFGRKKAQRQSVLSVRPATSATYNEKSNGSAVLDAPTIQVTNEDDRQRPRNRDVQNVHKLHRREGSITKRMRRHSEERKSRPISRPTSSYQSSSRQLSVDAHQGTPSRNSSHQRSQTYHGGASMPSPDQVGLAVTADIPREPSASSSPTAVNHDNSPKAKQPLAPIAHNVPHKTEPQPPGHSQQPPQQDVRLPTVKSASSSTQPKPRFPKAQAQKHALGILVKVWLLIASLYRRASMFEDAREACEEASKHASHVEALVATQESSARAFADRGWGGGKSSDELWADIFAERGYLLLAESSPHAALDAFEKAVLYYPDHVKATIGLSNILLDISDQTIPPEPPRPELSIGISSLFLLQPSPLIRTDSKTSESSNTNKPLPPPPTRTLTSTSTLDPARPTTPATAPATSDENRKTPSSLNRIAARDRAYGLLSTLTKLGTAWDSSEAWLALARAYEIGGEVERAKSCLWWVVELEDRRPVRHWWGVGGGYVL